MEAEAIPDKRAIVTARAAWGGYFAFLCFIMVVIGLESALHFVGAAIDGPFQLYNSLRRIWSGQHGGVDFQFFHGLGIPYLHYIPFRLLGGGFMGSEIARELVSVIAYPVTIVIVLRFFLRDWTRTLAWAAIVMAASIALRMTSMLVAINSLLGIRSTLPTLIPVALCLRAKPSIRTVITGVLLGGALVMGTEQGLAVLMGIVISFAVIAIRAKGAERRAAIVEALVIVALGIGVLLASLVTIGGVSGMRAALNYNFRLIPMDQYWYFGSPPNIFLSSWGAIPRIMSTLPRIPIALMVGAATAIYSLRILWRDAETPRGREQLGFSVLALYGIISCASLLGTYANAYIQPLLRCLLLLGAILGDRYLPARDTRLGRRPLLGVGPTVVGVAVAITALMGVIVPAVKGTVLETIPHLISQHIIHRVGPIYAEMWPETIVRGQAIYDAKKDSLGHPPVLWSTYAGLLEARNGIFHPTVDYIIHALGPEARAKYVTDFKRIQPDLVQTVSPAYTQYEGWIESTSWDFYSELLQNYDITGTTPWSYFWTRRGTPEKPPEQVWSTKILPEFDGIQLPEAPTFGGGLSYVLYQVEIEYETDNPLHSLPIIGSSPRYLLSAEGALQRDPVTLNPYVKRERFPLIVKSGSKPVLHWGAYSLLPGAKIIVKAIRLSLVHTSARNGRWLVDLINQQQDRTPQFR